MKKMFGKLGGTVRLVHAMVSWQPSHTASGVSGLASGQGQMLRGRDSCQAGCNQLVTSMVRHNFRRAAPFDAAYNCMAACPAPPMEVVCCHHSMQCQVAATTLQHVQPMHTTLKSRVVAIL
jgi:hypothetical protein